MQLELDQETKNGMTLKLLAAVVFDGILATTSKKKISQRLEPVVFALKS